MPTTHQTAQEPSEVAQRHGLHIVIVAALIIVPLYTAGTIRLSEYTEIPVVAPPPPLAPPRPCGSCSRSTYHPPKGKFELHAAKTNDTYRDSEERFSQARITSGEAALDFGGVEGGVPGGVIGGVVGGVLGEQGPRADTPSCAAAATKNVRVGSGLNRRARRILRIGVSPLARATAHLGHGGCRCGDG